MNTPYLTFAEARPVAALPLTFLAWRERAGSKTELTPFLRRAQESDGWFVAGDEECQGPMRFVEVMRLLQSGTGSVCVLHEKDAKMDPAPWQVITNRPQAPQGARAAMACAGLWILTLAIGWVLLSMVIPAPLWAAAGRSYFLACVALGAWFGLTEWRRRSAGTTPLDTP